MKINKIVAAGAAATLAVTSLASVASAKNPRSWSLVYNYGILQATPVVSDKGFNPLTSVDTNTNIFGTGPTQSNVVNTKGGITEAYDLLTKAGAGVDHARLAYDTTSDGLKGTVDRADTNADGKITDADFDAIIPAYITVNTDALIKDASDGKDKLLTAYAGNLKVVVKGRKRDNSNFVAIEKKTELRTNIAKINSNGNALNLKSDGATAVTVGNAMFTPTDALGVDMTGSNATFAYFPLFVTAAPEGYIMPTDFDAVDNIKIDVSGMASFTWVVDDKDLYFLESDFIATGWNYDWLDYVRDAADEDDLVPFDTVTDWYSKSTTTGSTWTGNIDAVNADRNVTDRAVVTFEVPDLYEAGPVSYKSAIQLTGKSTKDADGKLIMDGEVVRNGLKADETRKGTPVAADDYDAQGNIKKLTPATQEKTGNLLIEKMCDLIDGIHVMWRVTVAELAESNAWLPMTDVLPTDGTLYRNEIWLLSDTGDHESATQNGYNISGVNFDTNQTYTVEDYRRGTRPLGFAGLASQVADYFNKELNGTITFTFADVSNLNGRTWLNGGIPSTEVGLRNVLSGANPDDFALYFNYASTTGSLETVVDIDVDAGEVTFDISNLLDQLGGYTIGTIHDIYYGMTKYTSLRNGNVPGMWVSQVTLRAEDGADVSPAVEDDDVTTVEDDDDDVAIEDDDDDIAIEDDDDVAIEDDDDIAIEDDDDIAIEDDDDTAGEVEVISGDDDDANPHTGVALAVVPAIVAAAAIVVSKKRK